MRPEEIREMGDAVKCESTAGEGGGHAGVIVLDDNGKKKILGQTDPTFKTTRLYIRLSAKAMREQLIKQKGYSDAELPSSETIRIKLNQLGYHPRRVQKTQPLKKIPETNAIFEQLHQVNKAADADPTVLRISMDAKATVKLGRFSRSGVARVIVKALDHDFNAKKKLTPFGIFLPQHDELYLYFTPRVTSDFIVDCLRDFWLTQGNRFPQVKTLVLNQDNGPECNSRRSQFLVLSLSKGCNA